jgi:phosphoribosylformimino-5-aminoimidazole carboxamide ribotide isomerase
MKVLFAMDLMENKVVRLKKGVFSNATIYSDDPLAKIEEMVSRGAKDFHIIDLDGARTGRPVHKDVIKQIRSKVAGYMEVGGGVRDEATIRSYIEFGIDGIIMGTRVIEDRGFFKTLSGFKNIIVGLDLYEGRPMVKGWKQKVDIDIRAIIDEAERVGVMAILCTSIAKDGMLEGPDYEGMGQVLKMTSLPVIASGGVTTIDDIKRLKDMGSWAVIIGKALYEGLIKIEEAIEYAD